MIRLQSAVVDHQQGRSLLIGYPPNHAKCAEQNDHDAKHCNPYSTRAARSGVHNRSRIGAFASQLSQNIFSLREFSQIIDPCSQRLRKTLLSWLRAAPRTI